jgi:hypothetical protein
MYHSHSSWGPALGGAAIVNVCTLIGVAILAIPKLTRDSEGKRMTTLASGFAAGTLLASAFYLLLPEALLSISGTCACSCVLVCCLYAHRLAGGEGPPSRTADAPDAPPMPRRSPLRLPLVALQRE